MPSFNSSINGFIATSNRELLQENCASPSLTTLYHFFSVCELAGAALQKSLDVDSIGDLTELCEIAKAVGMKTEGFETIKQMKNKLREHIKEESKRREFAKVSLL